MSFEGYYQKLCSKGHYLSVDVYNESQFEVCPICKGPFVWENLVNTTNGSYDDEDERIDGYIPLEVDKITHCRECGHVIECTYKIPKKEEG